MSTWLERLRTRPQAADDPQVPRDVIASWPNPCKVCGAHWKLTPAGRFHIEHFAEVHHGGAKKRFVPDAPALEVVP